MFSSKLSLGNYISNYSFKLLVLFFILFSIGTTAGHAQINLKQKEFRAVIENFDAYLTDRPLAFNEILDANAGFIKAKKVSPDEYHTQYIWIKFSLKNSSNYQGAKWHILSNIIPFKSLTYFVSQKDGLWTKETINAATDKFPRILETQFAIPITNLRYGENTVYLRFEGLESFTKISPFTFYSDDEFLSKHSNHLVFMGGIIAILGAMVFYNLILFAIVKRRYFLLYCLFNSALVLLAIVASNVLYDSISIFSGPMWWNYKYFAIGIGASTLTFFLLDFLEKEKLEKWMIYAVLSTGTLLLLVSLVSLLISPKSLSTYAFVFNISILLSTLAFLGVLIRAILKESRAAKLILISVLVLSIAIIVKSISGIIYSVHPIWIDNFFYFGMAAQGMLLSIALADRLNQRKLESEIKRIEAVEKGQSSTDLALRDELTSLRNRRFIEKVAPQMVEGVNEGSGEFSLMICGVDGLAEVNQNHGRDMGDAAIKAVAEVLKASLPGEDCIARYRGSEFVILLEGSNETIALGFGKQLKEMIKSVKLPDELSDATLTFSIGVSPAVKQDKHIDEVIKRAEMGLFAAKQAGGNMVMGMEALGALMGRNLLPHDKEEATEQTSQADQALPAGLEHTAAAKKIKTEAKDTETETETETETDSEAEAEAGLIEIGDKAESNPQIDDDTVEAVETDSNNDKGDEEPAEKEEKPAEE